MSTVLLLGGRSFIGGHVCRVLVQRGYRVLLQSSQTYQFDNLADLLPHRQITPIVCSYDQPEPLRHWMAQADFLIFMAAPPGKQTLGQGHALLQTEHRLQQILAAAAQTRMRKSVFISTCGSIGTVSQGLADENCIAKDSQGWRVIPFKRRLEARVQAAVAQGLDISIVNPTMLIGTHDPKPSTGEFFRFIESFPFVFLKNAKANFVAVQDAALGTVLALERGRAGERYLLSGVNFVQQEFIARIKRCSGRAMPRWAIPYWLSLTTAIGSEWLNLILQRPAPLAPLIGIELTVHGSQHYSSAKAERELGYRSHASWETVDQAYQWYWDHGIVKGREKGTRPR